MVYPARQMRQNPPPVVILTWKMLHRRRYITFWSSICPAIPRAQSQLPGFKYGCTLECIGPILPFLITVVGCVDCSPSQTGEDSLYAHGESHLAGAFKNKETPQ